MKKYKIVLLSGDGIAPEISEVSKKVLKKLSKNHNFNINFNKEGKWLVLLENQIGAELPWALIKQSEAKDIIFLEG